MLAAFTSVVALNCTTPTASFWRTPPSRPQLAISRRAFSKVA